MQHRAEHDEGFTLMELLVAMALLGLLTMVMLGSMRFGVQAWARADGAITSRNAMRVAENLLRTDLVRAYPLFMTDDSNASVAFDGLPRRMSFLAPSTGTPGALERVTLQIDEDNGEAALIRSATLELSANSETRRTTLLGHLKEIEFSYLGAIANEAAPVWHRQWRQQTRLPSLIRLRLQSGRGTWQEWVVAPRIDADVGCVFDPLTKSCRGR